MAAEQPKKPVGGAYGRFLAEKRDEIKASLPAGHKITDVAKKAGELWKALPQAEKAKYEELFKTAQEAYVNDMEAFKVSGGVVVPRKSKKAKEAKKKKDAKAPKKPAGGGYGRFLAEKRKEIKAALPEGHKMTDVGKKAGEMWKELPKAEQARYVKLYEEAMEEYRRAMEEYKSKDGGEEAAEPEEAAATAAPAKNRGRKAGTAGSSAEALPKKRGRKTAGGSGDSSPAEALAKAPAKKRKCPPASAGGGKSGTAGASSTPPPKKRGRRAGIAAPTMAAVPLDAATLRAAQKSGLEAQLHNLAGRADVAASGKQGTELLAALEKAGGLVHPARHALLGA